MSPGTYLRMRREAAGLSIDDVALLISDSDRWLRFNAIVIELVEDDRHIPTASFVDRLRRAVRFDPHIFRILGGRSTVAGVRIPAPALCRRCACSWCDPCHDDSGSPCAWAEPDLCTACAGVAIAHLPGDAASIVAAGGWIGMDWGSAV